MKNLTLAILFLSACAGSPTKTECNQDALRDTVPPVLMKVVQEQPVDWSTVDVCTVDAVIAELRTGRPLGGKVALPDRAIEYRAAQVEKAAGLR